MPWLRLAALVARWGFVGTLAALAAGTAFATVTPPKERLADARAPAALLARGKAVMAADPQEAVRMARAAERALTTQPVTDAQQLEIATAQWLTGEGLMRLNDIAAAKPAVLAALETTERLAPGSTLAGKLLSSRAGLNAANGQLDKALNDYQGAFAIFRRLGDTRAEAVALQNIGSIYQDAADYDRVLYYYGLSAEIYPNDLGLQLSGNNNRANALDQLGRHREAEQAYEKALSIAAGFGNPAVQARILDNLAQSQIEQGKLASASRNVARGLALARGADSAGWYPLLLGTAARLALRQGEADRASALLERAFRAAGDQAETAPYRDMHLTAYEAFKRSGNVAGSLVHFEIFKRLDDQGRSLAASTSATLAAARFDFANQNSRIAALKTGQLKRDFALARLEARQLEIIIGALLVLAAIATVMLSLYLRSLRRSRNAIAASNAKLSTVNGALEDALLAKTQFLATTSHEIRTPLNGVLGMTQVLLADPGVVGDIRERVALMHQAGETMRMLVDDILDAAKNDTDAFQLDRKPIVLPGLLREAVTFWSDKAQASDLMLKLDLMDCPETIIEDETRLRQVVYNIVANAIRFTPAGEISIAVATPTVADAEWLEIRISDTGIGIPEHRIEDIFDKFVQLDSGIARQFGGTGLGLAICRKLSRAMGGDVVVASVVGVGSCFTLKLPLHKGPTAEAPASARDEEPGRTLAGASVVAVQPNPLGRGMMAAMLSDHVGDLQFVATLAGALESFGTAKADLILVDGTSLAAGGSESVAELRCFLHSLAAHAVPVALLWPDDDQRIVLARLLTTGAGALIVKPVSAEDLVGRMRSLLENAVSADRTSMMAVKP